MPEHSAPLTEARSAWRLALCEKSVTLNGKPARVSGASKPFATVTDTATGLSAEWSWEAVERIVNRGGRFQA